MKYGYEYLFFNFYILSVINLNSIMILEKYVISALSLFFVWQFLVDIFDFPITFSIYSLFSQI